MSSLIKSVQNCIKRIDFEISLINKEIQSVGKDVDRDLAIIAAGLSYPPESLPDLSPYRERLITLKKSLLGQAKSKLTDIRDRLTFALE